MREARRNHAKRYTIDSFMVHHVTGIGVNERGCQDLQVFCRYCDHCKAVRSPFESQCCLAGRINCDPFPDVPVELQNLMMNEIDFKQKIRAINQAFSFSSIGARVDQNVNNNQHNAYCFRINGVMYHRLGGFLPQMPNHPNAVPNQPDARFSQIFFFDRDEQMRIRQNIFQDVDEAHLLTVTDVMEDINPFVGLYQMTRNVPLNQLVNMKMVFTCHGVDPRTYNEQLANEVGAIVPDDAEVNSRDLVLRSVNDVNEAGQVQLHRISQFHPNHDPLAYPLLFPQGTAGWHRNIEDVNGRPVTMLQFYRYHVQIRKTDNENGTIISNPIHRGARLFQQYLVDMAAKIDDNNINWFRQNQQTIRRAHQQGLEDAIANGNDNVGTILPSSKSGGPRDLHQRYLDSMALVTQFGKPSYFITMTCNPKWIEIERELLPNQTANDRPDIVSRVFNCKFRMFLDDLKRRGVLGKHVAHTYTIEFQKRGLPHAHLLLWVAENDAPSTVEVINRCVYAELPDPEINQPLAETVQKHMIHGPCGALNQSCPCMKNGTCSKSYPKPFVEETEIPEDGFPKYRRRNNGRVAFVRNQQVDNRWVVPYNPYLVQKYNCHVNVEICSTVASVKYIHKYIHKGPDRGSLQVVEPGQDAAENTNNGQQAPVDEIRKYLEGRYICPNRAIWMIMGFPFHNMSHSVERLPVHLPNHQIVYFHQNANLEEVAAQNRDSKLMAFFTLCEENEGARQYRYPEIPLHYTWKASQREWRPRRTNTMKIARMYAVSPAEGERFFLRVLLNHRAGPTSFEDLRTVHGVQHETFRSAAVALGVLQDDIEWQNAMQEAAQFQMPRQLRQMFAMILLFGQPQEPSRLFHDFGPDLWADFQYQHPNILQPTLTTLAALHIRGVLRDHHKDWDDFNLPTIDWNLASIAGENDNPLLNEELNHPINPEEVAQAINNLNVGQRECFDTVLGASVQGLPKFFFLDGPGGYGKTFLYGALAGELRRQGKVVLACASSGIAATLLVGGRTAHSRFKIPLDLYDESTCSIPAESHIAQLIRQTSLIIWDEAPMAHRRCFEAVDRSLRDVRGNQHLFGGVTMLAGGDFRQILPVIRNGNEPQILNASLIRSPLWQHVERFSLSQNMRVMPEEIEFSNFLLTIGNGTAPTLENGRVAVPTQCLLEDQTLECLIDHVFEDIENQFEQNQESYFASRVILAPKRRAVAEINDTVLARIPGVDRVYQSADSVMHGEDDDALNFPVEFLNTLRPSGLPPHRLVLKLGVVVILLRNLSPRYGLCNGTRMRITALHNHVIEGEILLGANAGSRHFIPRIDCCSHNSGLPFELRRRQFPIDLCFAMTINKSQGQTIERIGLDLREDVFTHGQLYVALSRARSWSKIHILSNDEKSMENVVYPGALLTGGTVPSQNVEEGI